jgi:hypothetical protein
MAPVIGSFALARHSPLPVRVYRSWQRLTGLVHPEFSAFAELSKATTLFVTCVVFS